MVRGIEVALLGRVTRAGELRLSKAGKQWLCFSVEVGEGEKVEYANVAAFYGDIADLAPQLTAGVEVYIEGGIKLRRWQNSEGVEQSGLAVTATDIKPLGLIGERRPRKTRAAKAKELPPPPETRTAKPFDDPLPF